jgi:5-methylcytosine-specific restriction endonuclease McrA
MPINYKDYPPNWRKEIRPAILEREGHKCKFCGVPNHIWVYAASKRTGRVWVRTEEELHKLLEDPDICIQPNVKRVKVILTIAHLYPTDSKMVSDPERLAALCQRCHLTLDAPYKVKYRKEAQPRRKAKGPKPGSQRWRLRMAQRAKRKADRVYNLACLSYLLQHHFGFSTEILSDR